MSKPVQGKEYTIVSGDWLWTIAARAYGDPRHWQKIYRANDTRLKSGDPNLIFPGEVIYIPPLDEVRESKIKAKENRFASRPQGTFNLTIGDREVPVTSGRFMRGIDLLAFSWTALIPWTPGDDPAFDKLIRKYSYAPSELYLGSELVATGRFYDKKPHYRKDGITVDLEFFSETADLMDSTAIPPYDFYDSNLQAITDAIAPGYAVLFKTPVGPKFDQATIGAQEKKGPFLQRLASQRGYLCSTDERSRIVYLKSIASGKPVAHFRQGEGPLAEFDGDFDGRKRFAVHRVMGSSGDGSDISSVFKDSGVPVSRQMTYSAQDVDAGTVNQTAEYRARKSLAEALSQPINLPDWYDDSGNLWAPNTLVTQTASALDMPDPVDLVIRTVEFVITPEGRSAVLSVVPPFVLGGGKIPEVW